MSTKWIMRSLLIASTSYFTLPALSIAQHTDTSGGHDSHASDSGGGHSGGQHGRPTDRHDGGDDHGDDHDHDDDHGDDHGSGGKGKGPKYRGGREALTVGAGRGHSLEDRVLKTPDF